MSIKDIGEKIKSYWTNDIFIGAMIILVGLAGFGLGKLSALEKNRGEVQIKKMASSTLPIINQTSQVIVPLSAAALVAGEKAEGLLVASKSGKKYHFPWCAGASQIVEKNKIWYATYEEAQKAGYTPASNCPGLK